MPKHLDYFRFAKKVRAILLASGEDGIQQAQLYHRVRTRNWDISDLTGLLDAWMARNWVQSFSVVPYGAKRPATIWRATTLLSSEFHDVTATDLGPSSDD